MFRRPSTIAPPALQAAFVVVTVVSVTILLGLLDICIGEQLTTKAANAVRPSAEGIAAKLKREAKKRTFMIVDWMLLDDA